MRAIERQKNIMSYLRQGSKTMDELALVFNVSRRTILRDIEQLSLIEPIYTVMGGHGGGVYLKKSIGNGKLNLTQMQYDFVLEQFKNVPPDKIPIMNSILDKIRCSNHS